MRRLPPSPPVFFLSPVSFMMIVFFWVLVFALSVGSSLGSEAINYNGGSVLAMAGKGCVAVAVDQRLGVGNFLIGEKATRLLACGPRSVVALRGLQGDVQTFMEDVDARLRLRWIQEGGEGSGPRAAIDADKLSAMVSLMLYGSRSSKRRTMPFFLEPVVAGVLPDGEVYLCGQDSLGAQLTSRSFVVAGTATQSLHGACEALYEPDLDPDALVDQVLKCMTAGLTRDCLAGRKVIVYLVTQEKEGLTTIERPLITLPSHRRAEKTTGAPS